MKIDAFTRLFYANSQSSNNSQQKTAVTTGAAEQAQRTDSVTISSRSSQIAADYNEVSRSERVAEIRRQVADGSYRQPSSELLARKLAEELFA